MLFPWDSCSFTSFFFLTEFHASLLCFLGWFSSLRSGGLVFDFFSFYDSHCSWWAFFFFFIITSTISVFLVLLLCPFLIFLASFHCFEFLSLNVQAEVLCVVPRRSWLAICWLELKLFSFGALSQFLLGAPHCPCFSSHCCFILIFWFFLSTVFCRLLLKRSHFISPLMHQIIYQPENSDF